MSDNPNWKDKLNEWLATPNQRTMPDDLRQLREEFVRRFPKEKLGEMTLPQYASEQKEDRRDSFCHWLEVRTRKLCGLGRVNPKNRGVWWEDNSWHCNKWFKTDNAENALAQIKQGLVELVKAVEEQRFEVLDEIGAKYLGPRRYALRAKPLYLYFPEEFLPINKPDHLRDFLRHFGDEPKGDLLARNRQLLSKLRDLPEFSGFDTYQMMHFLYNCLRPGAEPPVPPPPGEESVILQELRDLLARTRNLILYGPPGCGKTYWARKFACEFKERCEFVTFHQSFAYEEFVEGLKPLPPADGDTHIKYEVVPGVFRSICREAEAAWRDQKKDPPKYLLIIDEISRANTAKVFGELITLIEDDKRLGEKNEIEATLPYSGDKFGVPPNLYILGTMNTADRSIALLDLALRRRFTFREIMPDPSVPNKAVEGVNLGQLLTRLNERIRLLLDRDHQIGHSYFLLNGDKAGLNELHFAWYRRVIPLLQEYFYNAGERLQKVLGDEFVQRVKIAPETSKALGEVFDGEAPYEVVALEGELFLGALRHLTGTAANQTNTT
jgi:DNA polymerase III delta prime subunit